MCGLLAILDAGGGAAALRELALKQGCLLPHRGPDWSGI